MNSDEHHKLTSAAFDLGMLQRTGKTNDLLTSLTQKLKHQFEQQRNDAETEKIRCGAIFELNKGAEQLWEEISTNPNEETSKRVVYTHIDIINKSKEFGILNQKNFTTLEYKNLCDQYIKKLVDIEKHECFQRVEQAVKAEIQQLEDAERARQQAIREEQERIERASYKKTLTRWKFFLGCFALIVAILIAWVMYQNNLCRNDKCRHIGLIKQPGGWLECPKCGEFKQSIRLLD